MISESSDLDLRIDQRRLWQSKAQWHDEPVTERKAAICEGYTT
jgi:hypothetical protein